MKIYIIWRSQNKKMYRLQIRLWYSVLGYKSDTATWVVSYEVVCNMQQILFRNKKEMSGSTAYPPNALQWILESSQVSFVHLRTEIAKKHGTKLFWIHSYSIVKRHSMLIFGYNVSESISHSQNHFILGEFREHL